MRQGPPRQQDTVSSVLILKKQTMYLKMYFHMVHASDIPNVTMQQSIKSWMGTRPVKRVLLLSWVRVKEEGHGGVERKGLCCYHKR